METIKNLIYILPAVLIALIGHEVAHGYVSYKLGDPTPKQEGRLSLNPLKHLDPIGTLCLIFFRFGWAKPVQVNPYYYKHKKRGMAMVALAGPVTNMVIAFISFIFMGLIIKMTGGQGGDVAVFFFNFLSYLVSINLGLGVFNLIPFPPLDGSKILGAVLPEDKYFKVMQYEKYGYFILLALLYFNVLNRPLSFITGSIFNGMWTVVSILLGLH